MNTTPPTPAADVTDEQILKTYLDWTGGPDEKIDFARRVLALRPAPVAATGKADERAWQAIETAPKDEMTILLSVPTRRGKWNRTLPLAGKWMGYWVIFNADEAVQRVYHPTHWMPLPAPPALSTPETTPPTQPEPAA